jgi:hypothetical protein
VTRLPDSLSAGGEGTLPADFVPWQRGVTCTVRPEWLAPIDACRTYLANVTVQRSAPLHEPFADYGALYHLYTDFDRTGGSSRDVTLSYGEYANDAPADYAPFVRRAERFVESYDPSLELLMREWRATETNKTADLPWIVVMETYLRRR